MSQVTKRALEQSLKTLLSKRPLESITIQDLTDECGVSRMTFYYHFKDIYDLIEWSLEEDAAKALAGMKTYDTWQKGYLQILHQLLDNRDFILCVYHSISPEQLERYLHMLTYDLLILVVNEQAKDIHVSQKDREFIANFFKYGFVGITLDWIKDGMKEDPEVMIERLSALIHGDMQKALLAYSEEKI